MPTLALHRQCIVAYKKKHLSSYLCFFFNKPCLNNNVYIEKRIIQFDAVNQKLYAYIQFSDSFLFIQIASFINVLQDTSTEIHTHFKFIYVSNVCLQSIQPYQILYNCFLTVFSYKLTRILNMFIIFLICLQKGTITLKQHVTTAFQTEICVTLWTDNYVLQYHIV